MMSPVPVVRRLHMRVALANWLLETQHLTRIGTHHRMQIAAYGSVLFLVTSGSIPLVSFWRTRWGHLLKGLLADCSAWHTAIMLLKTQ